MDDDIVAQDADRRVARDLAVLDVAASAMVPMAETL